MHNLLPCRSITSKTKVLLLNSPHNPTGKVFSLTELEAIAEVVRDHPQVTVISDEVYKYTIYDPQEPGDGAGSPPGHYHFARLPGKLSENASTRWLLTSNLLYITVMIRHVGPNAHNLQRRQDLLGDGVAGGVDGWAGEIRQSSAASPPLCAILHSYAHAGSIVDCTHRGGPPVRRPLQVGMAVTYTVYIATQLTLSLILRYSYYEWLRHQFAHKRKILEEGLRAAGIEPMTSSGGFFLMGKLPSIPALHQSSSFRLTPPLPRQQAPSHIVGNAVSDLTFDTEPYDWTYCRHLAEHHGVIGIPAAPFFSRDDYSSHYSLPPLARFAFCKRDDTLHEAARRLRSAPKTYSSSAPTNSAVSEKDTK